MEKRREYKFQVVREPHGFNVIYHMNDCIPVSTAWDEGERHVVELKEGERVVSRDDIIEAVDLAARYAVMRKSLVDEVLRRLFGEEKSE